MPIIQREKKAGSITSFFSQNESNIGIESIAWGQTSAKSFAFGFFVVWEEFVSLIPCYKSLVIRFALEGKLDDNDTSPLEEAMSKHRFDMPRRQILPYR
ncbi:hypothetical protein EYC84_004137 [Monilinia fructicola]|uniref:Uncharacterized protein n=1 Tax=Monilinia fructicola TaxID=38448 RepID=A0A5M9JZC6_MONFR|nr:hypothetical protein EYC84_004137 [Monilinia fructicola]